MPDHEAGQQSGGGYGWRERNRAGAVSALRRGEPESCGGGGRASSRRGGAGSERDRWHGGETNVAREADAVRLVQQVTEKYGGIDLFCSNAGTSVLGGVETPDADWQRVWNLNVMAHVYAARAVLPGMLARREGYLLQTISAAGLLTLIGSAPYSVTKHAALALAEWLVIAHGDQGIKVSALCPLAVRTDMLLKGKFGDAPYLLNTAVEPEQVAEAVVKGLADEKFLILPHPEVAEYFQRKASDYDRWLRGMRRLQANTQSPRAAN